MTQCLHPCILSLEPVEFSALILMLSCVVEYLVSVMEDSVRLCDMTLTLVLPWQLQSPCVLFALFSLLSFLILSAVMGMTTMVMVVGV